MINKFNAPIIAIIAASILAIGKAIVGFASGSLAVISSAADSFSDIVASALNFLLIKKADAPPDKDHPFGHGKMEAYATLIQSMIILCSGLFLIYKALTKSETEGLPLINYLTIGTMLASIVVSIGISTLLKKTAKKENSQALEADAAHYSIDVLTNIGVLVTIIIVKLTKIVWIDSAIATIMSVYIINTAVRLQISALKILLDFKIQDDELSKIKKTLQDYEKYNINYHKLRTRTDGYTNFLDMHITLCNNLSFEEAHKFCDILEDEIKKQNNRVDITIHPEPCDGRCQHKNCAKQKLDVQRMIKDYEQKNKN